MKKVRLSWPLLLSQEEKNFLKDYVCDWRNVKFYVETDDIIEILQYKNKVKLPNNFTKENLTLSFFGFTFTGKRAIVKKESVLERYIVKKELSKNILASFMRNSTYSNMSLLFVLLLLCASDKKEGSVGVLDAREVLHEMLSLFSFDVTQKEVFYFFDTYFLGNRKESFYFLDGENSLSKEKVVKEFDYGGVFSIQYILQ